MPKRTDIKKVTKEHIASVVSIWTGVPVSKLTKDFVNRKEKEGLLEYDYSDLPRAFVLVDGERSKIVLSRISPQGLKLRADATYEASEIEDEE